MKFNAKKLLVAALAVALVSAVSVAGTLALRAVQEQAELPLVQITGPKLNGSIVPGTTLPNDSAVLLQGGDAGYVFLEVTDTTGGLVSYELDDLWKPMEGVAGLYYQQVNERTAEQSLNILKNKKVSYSTALNNLDMVDEDGNLKQGLTLNFKAYAVLQPGINLADAEKLVPREISTARQFHDAVADGRSVKLTEDITLPWNLTITKPMVIDLNNHSISNPTDRPYTLVVENAEVKIRNGTIRSAYTEASENGVSYKWSGYALYLRGGADVTVDHCKILVTGVKPYEPYAVYVDKPAGGLAEPKLVMTNTTIDTTDKTKASQYTSENTPDDPGTGGYAAYIKAGDVTMKNCTVTGWVCIRGGNVTLDGGTYSTRRFYGQGRIWNAADTAEYVSGKALSDSAFTMGDCITIMDGGLYDLGRVTIQNVKFDNTIIVPNYAKPDDPHWPVWPVAAYAIKYVNVSADATHAALNISNNTYERLIDNAAPVMFIDKNGANITYAPANP